MPLDGLATTAHSTANARFTVNRVNHGVVAGDLIMVCSYQQGAIFQVTAANQAAATFDHTVAGAPGNCSKGLGLPTDCSTATGTTWQFPNNSLVGRFIAAGWYIGNNGRPETGGRSLFRVTRAGVEEVAEGVRDMQLAYLLDNGTDYVNAAAVEAAAAPNWARVVAVRFDLSYESPAVNVATTGGNGRITRPVFFTVNLRNMQP